MWAETLREHADQGNHRAIALASRDLARHYGDAAVERILTAAGVL